VDNLYTALLISSPQGSILTEIWGLDYLSLTRSNESRKRGLKMVTVSALIQVTKTYEESAIWEALTGSDFAGLNYWISEMDCDWEQQFAPFPVTHLDQQDKEVTTIVTKEMIIAGFTKAIQADYKHCNGITLFYGEDGDDYDACFADIVLQCAIFGDVIFG